MVPKSILDQAKAFLCWDAFPDLAVQLVPLQSAAAFYFPPGGTLQAIVVFYDGRLRDFTEPLFLLFHEAGHALQRRRLAERGAGDLFARCMALDRGSRRAAFERRAWRLGGKLFAQFAEAGGLSSRLLEKYAEYGGSCAASYESTGRDR